MYAYRKMSDALRQDVVQNRRQLQYPWHAPPHFDSCDNLYLITAVCYEHKPVMDTEQRRNEFYQALIPGLENVRWASVRAYVIVPNHYHILARLSLAEFRTWISRLHNGKATQWNREDDQRGRKVWYRFTDRQIRSERHYFATLNYIHANPLKHGYAPENDEWVWSSARAYKEHFGAETLNDWWRRYPVNDYGKGWDD